MNLKLFKYMIALLLFTAFASVSGQTNAWNYLLYGDYDGFGKAMVRSIISSPLEYDVLAKTRILNQYEEYWTNSGLMTNACQVVLASSAEPYVKYRMRERLMDYYANHGQIERSHSYMENNGYFNGWNVTGPFTEVGSDDLETLFAFEKSWDETVLYKSMMAPVRTAILLPFSTLGKYAPFYGKWPAFGTSYLTSSVSVSADGVYYLHLQTADPFKLWVNGKFILKENNKAEKNTTDTFIRFDLKKGQYMIVVKMLRLSRLPILRTALLDSKWIGIKSIEMIPRSATGNTNFGFSKWEPIDHSYYREKTENNLGTAENYFYLGLLELFNGHENFFVKNMKQAINHDKKNIFYKYFFAQYFLNHGEYPNSGRLNLSMTYLKEMSTSTYPVVFDLLGNNEFQSRHYSEAVKFFMKAISLNPDSFLFHYHLANVYFEQNWENEFIASAERTYKKNPSFSDTTDILFKYFDNRNSPKADEYRAAYWTKYPYSLDNLALAKSYVYKGKYDKASEILKKMEDMFPNLKETGLIRAEIKMRQSTANETEKIYEAQLKKMPQDIQIMETAGKAELLLGQEASGLTLLKKTLSSDPGNSMLADRISLLETGHYYDLREYINIDKDPEILKQAFESTNATDSGALILSEEEALKLNWDGSWYKLVRQFIKITDKKGIERWASPSIDNFSRMKVLRACTHLKNGEKIDVSEIKKQGSKLVISFPSVKKGVVLELVYLIPGSFENTAFDTSYFTSEFSIFRTQDDSIRNIKYYFITPKELNVNVRKGNFDSSISVSTWTNGGQNILTFTASEQKALKEESAMPSLADLVPWVSISTFPNNNEIFRRWFKGVVDPFLEVEPEHDEKLFELMDNKDLSNKGINQIRNIYFWINRNIMITKGDIYSPQKSRKTLDTRTGSTMDKVLLMKLFLKRIGVNSDIVLFRSDSMPIVDMSIVDPALYDDVVLKICFGGRTNYLDMENRYIAYGDFTWEKFGMKGMNMTTGKEEILPKPDFSKEENAIVTINNITIETDGMVKMKSSRLFRGCFSIYQEVLMDEENRDLTINQMENRNIRGLSVTNIVFTPIENTNHFFEYTFEGKVSSWLGGIDTGNEKTVPLLASKSRLFETYITDMTRKNPLKIFTPLRSKQMISYKTIGWKIKSIPESVDLETEYGVFKMEYKKIDNTTVSIQIETILPGQTISVSKYAGFVDFCKKAGDAEKGEVVLEK